MPCVATSPLPGILSKPDEAVKRRPRPIDDLIHRSMFQGIDVNVINTAFDIVIITTGVFIKASLPNRSFILVISAS